jgi:hypothetical protein
VLARLPGRAGAKAKDDDDDGDEGVSSSTGPASASSAAATWLCAWLGAVCLAMTAAAAWLPHHAPMGGWGRW